MNQTHTRQHLPAVYFYFVLLATLFCAACEPSQQTTIRSIADVTHARIGVTSGSTPAQLAYERFPEATISEFGDSIDSLGALKAGHIDVTITSINSALRSVENNPDLVVVDAPLREEPTCAAVKKGNTELRDQVNDIIRQIRADGTLADMQKRWLKREPGPYETRQYPQHTTGTLLRVGVSATREPFSFVNKDGKVTGHDGELARLIGARLERPLEFVDMRWDGLIPALQAGKIDIIVTGMSYTEERAKRIEFTENYYSNKLVLLARAPQTASVRETSFWTRAAASFHSNLIVENRYMFLWEGLQNTVWLSIFSTLLGTALGAVVCYMRMSPLQLLRVPAVVYISIMRGIPVLVLLMLIFYVIFASTQISPVVVAIIAFGLHFAAYVAEIFRTGVQSIDRGQTEAGVSLGFTRIATFRHIILPQTIQRILPVYKGEFISMVKMTSIVGYVAVQDLTKASDIIRSRTFDAFFPLLVVAVLYYLIAWLLTQSLEYIERRTDPKHLQSRSTRS